MTASCGTSHKTDIGTTFESSFDFATLSLFFSTNADIQMLIIVRTWPVPIRWSGVKVRLSRLWHAGIKSLSQIMRKTAVEISTKTSIEAAGILKCGPIRRSIFRDWRTAKLLWMPIGVAKKMLEDHSGNILMRFLSCSTCCTVHVFHGFAFKPFELISPSVLSAAWFKNLIHHKQKITYLVSIRSFHAWWTGWNLHCSQIYACRN